MFHNHGEHFASARKANRKFRLIPEVESEKRAGKLALDCVKMSYKIPVRFAVDIQTLKSKCRRVPKNTRYLKS